MCAAAWQVCKDGDGGLFLDRLPAAAGTFEKLVKPVDGIESRMTGIHHITNRMVENAEPFETVAGQLCQKISDWAGGKKVFMVAHNGRDFDCGVMHRNYQRTGDDWLTALTAVGVVGFIDTYRLVHAHKLFPNKIEKEGMIYRHLFPGEDFPVEARGGGGGEHSALSDCLALARCIAHDKFRLLLCTKPVGVSPKTWLVHHKNLATKNTWKADMKAEFAAELEAAAAATAAADDAAANNVANDAADDVAHDVAAAADDAALRELAINEAATNEFW